MIFGLVPTPVVAATKPRHWRTEFAPKVFVDITTPKDGHFEWALTKNGKLLASGEEWGVNHAQRAAHRTWLLSQKGD